MAKDRVLEYPEEQQPKPITQKSITIDEFVSGKRTTERPETLAGFAYQERTAGRLRAMSADYEKDLVAFKQRPVIG